MIAARRVNHAMAFCLTAIAGATALLFAILGLGYSGHMIGNAYADAYIPADADDLPTVDAAIVLGTSPYGVRGQRNRTLSFRLKAAFDLWSLGKARYLVVSGNRIASQEYDEPLTMRAGLEALGVPPDFVYRDPGGVRTWESVIRARDVYGLRRVIIVSERDHLARALFIARHLGLEAWGYPAEGTTYVGWSGRIVGNLSILRAYYDLVVDRRMRADRKVSIGVDPPS
jgi:SanA protein